MPGRRSVRQCDEPARSVIRIASDLPGLPNVEISVWCGMLAPHGTPREVINHLNTEQTRQLVDRRILAALGSSGYLINISGGAIVDQWALIEALNVGTIAGAGLELFEAEPQVPAELMAMEQVMLVPHIGSSTREIRAQRQTPLLARLHDHFAGAALPDLVTEAAPR